MKKIILSLLIITTISSSAFAQPKVGMPSPDILLTNTEGTKTALSSLKGKVVLIDFWASWCGPCRIANRSMAKLYKKYQEKGFEIFSVSLDSEPQSWKQAIRTDKMTWLNVIDTRAASGNQLTNTWNIQFLPYTMLIDRDGKLYAVDPEKQRLENLIKKLL